jgi:uncharacterized membrane protein YfcA
MTLIQILGFFCSILIGLSLGLMGGGGSMLTIPVLVYLLGINPLLSTAYSLFVVGATSLIGSVNYIRKQQIHYQAALLFSLPSFSAIFFIRRYVIPVIPDPIFINESVRLSKSIAFMLLFAIVMLAASVSMIRDRKRQNSVATVPPRYDYFLLVLTGLLVGSLTGLTGIGGGFLIIPALVLLVQLPMKRAIGTSLLIIAANALIGFLCDPVHSRIDWPFLLGFTALAVLGILIGSYLSRFISSYKLRKIFGWSVLVLSLFIVGKETLTPLLSHNSAIKSIPTSSAVLDSAHPTKSSRRLYLNSIHVKRKNLTQLNG